MRNVTASTSVGPSPRRARSHRLARRGDHGEQVVAVHAHAREAVGRRLDRDARGRGLRDERHRDRPLVVLAEEHHRQRWNTPAKFGGGVEVAGRGGAVADVAHAHVVVLA